MALGLMVRNHIISKGLYSPPFVEIGVKFFDILGKYMLDEN
jgi:hypothetical protein